MMDYIVLDMEWNQPWPGSPSSQKQLPVAIRGEIIQIGAVRVTEAGQVADEFQIMVRPRVDLPQPDSPTTPMVLPAFKEKDTSSTAWTMPLLVGKYFFR